MGFLGISLKRLNLEPYKKTNILIWLLTVLLYDHITVKGTLIHLSLGSSAPDHSYRHKGVI